MNKMSNSENIDNSEKVCETNETNDTNDTNGTNDMNKYLFYVQTIQSSEFRILIEALKEILTDANFEFFPKTEDSEGCIKLLAVDQTHTVLVHLHLHDFQKFYCSKKMVIGLNMLNLFKLIKTMNNNDHLSLYIEKGNENQLCINIENGEKACKTVYKLNILDLPEDKINIPAVQFNSVITMPSGDFQKYIRDMHNLANDVEIKSIGETLYLSCKGDFAQQETTLGKAQHGMNFNVSDSSIVQGVFALKHLFLFTKCTNLCNNIEMYLRNDYPLIVKYAVGSLGEIKLCLAPIHNVQ